MIKIRHTTDTCAENHESYKEISKQELVKKFKNNKYTFYNGNITFQPIGYINNDYLQVKITNDDDKKFLHQLNIINTQKIISDLKYEIAFDYKAIETEVDINKFYDVIIDDIPCKYNIKLLCEEFLFTANSKLPALNNCSFNIIQEIGHKTVIIDDDLKHNLLKVRETNIFNIIYKVNLLKCYENRLNDIIFNGI